MSSMGITQISAIMPVVGGAYLPIMSDEAIVEKNRKYLPSRKLFGKAAIGISTMKL
jgi:acetyl-CoA carboxylase carboxyltransferase component